MNGRKCLWLLIISSGQTIQAVMRHATTPSVLVRFQSTPAKKTPANGHHEVGLDRLQVDPEAFELADHRRPKRPRMNTTRTVICPTKTCRA